MIRVDAAVQYIVELDELLGGKAKFRSDQHAAVFILPRDQWESMGRPGSLTVGVGVWDASPSWVKGES